jgi:hypothetical protein
VRFEGPLSLDGPVWQIETTAPRWPDTTKSDGKDGQEKRR